jgi:DinB family protein
MSSPASTPQPQDTRPLHSDLDDIQRQLHRLTSSVEVLVKSLDDAQMNWTPATGRWSIAQCLEHLTLTNRRYRQAMEEAIAQGRKDNRYSSGQYRHGWLGEKFVKSLEPGAGFKVKTLEAITPVFPLASEKVLREFFEENRTLVALADQANGLDLGRVRVTSPFLKLLKVSLGQAFRVITAHERRHLEQARAVRADRGFPVAQ